MVGNNYGKRLGGKQDETNEFEIESSARLY
jgi:hypothetical protein